MLSFSMENASTSNMFSIEIMTEGIKPTNFEKKSSIIEEIQYY